MTFDALSKTFGAVVRSSALPSVNNMPWVRFSVNFMVYLMYTAHQTRGHPSAQGRD